MPTAPPLGYGQREEAPINTVNQYMRGQPWYQTLIKSFGQNPNNVHLTDNQKQQVIRAAQANGVVVDEGHNGQEVDDSGNFQAKSHAVRNTLIVVGIAAATIATMGAAGVFAAGAGAGAGAAGTGATVAGVEGGAYGVGAGTVAALGGGAMAAAPVAGTLGGIVAPTAAAALGGGGGGGSTLGGAAGVGKFLSSPGGSTLASGLVNTFANIYGANKQADASKYGVDAQTAAAKYAADVQDAAAQRAEVFTRQQAETGWQSGEHTQKANYDQWRARQGAIMGSLGAQLGINYTPPDYSPGIDPHYTDAGSPQPGAPSTPAPAGPAPSVDASKGDLPGQISAYFKSRGVSDQETPYWVGKWSELDARGKELNDPTYANKRLAAADVFGGGGHTAAPLPNTATGTLATFVRPNYLPVTPYQPGTLGAYMGTR